MGNLSCKYSMYELDSCLLFKSISKLGTIQNKTWVLLRSKPVYCISWQVSDLYQSILVDYSELASVVRDGNWSKIEISKPNWWMAVLHRLGMQRSMHAATFKIKDIQKCFLMFQQALNFFFLISPNVLKK